MNSEILKASSQSVSKQEISSILTNDSINLYKIESFILGNGMRIVLNQDHSTNLISHYVVYNVGGLQDFHGKAGIAHFLEHMMFKSTKNFKEGELTKFFNDNGVSFNAGTGYELTVYYATFVSHLLENIMNFESDRMQNLILKEDEINIERNVIKEERRMRVENVITRSFLEKLEAIQYDSSYYGASLIGLMSDLDNIKIDDLQDFYDQYYDPSNATLILSGNIDLEKAKDLSEKYYGKLINRTKKNFIKDRSINIKLLELIKTKIGQTFYLDLKSDKAKSPTYIQVFSAPTLRSESENSLKLALALDILIKILKESKGMIYSELVEKQKIASNLNIYYDSFGEDYYPLKILINSDKNKGLDVFEEKIHSFFANDLKNLLTDEKIKKTARIIGINHLYAMDNLENRAEFISYAALVKQIQDPGEFLNEYPKLLFEITKDDILKVADEVFIKGPSTIGKILAKNEI
jgi:zinc protease